ncbi:hypothetical protein [Mesorhizobium sp. J428]|uniref:hypothetical protein n=1 Tax=Mesorhizobium sp. J428 TaxID=2898440 RepID=UPI002151D8B2|nr:hypothetical protein [Mesorhizobium sp. J428]MCR5858904.1 hypothetical protein [Mesorhizobium sp. J428]
MSDVTQQNLFRPARSKAESKADTTNNAARAILDDEAARREAKTAKLRQARLESEARSAAAAPTPKARKKK